MRNPLAERPAYLTQNRCKISEVWIFNAAEFSMGLTSSGETFSQKPKEKVYTFHTSRLYTFESRKYEI